MLNYFVYLQRMSSRYRKESWKGIAWEEIETIRRTRRNCKFEFVFALDRKQIEIKDLP